MAKDIEIIHWGTIKGDRKVTLDNPSKMEAVLDNIGIGERVGIVVSKADGKININQFRFFFGVIIPAMIETNEFGGWLKREVEQYLLFKLRSSKKSVIDKEGNERVVSFHEKIEDYNRSRMAEFINDVLNYLATEHDIHFEDPANYIESRSLPHKDRKNEKT